MTLPHSSRDWIAGLASEGVVTLGDPLLKAQAPLAGSVAEVAPLLAAMVARLRSLNGAGLAAPQIAASVQVVVIEVRKTDIFPDRPEYPLTQMVNPVIVERSDTWLTDWEGCFSVPGIMGLVARHEWVTVAYLDETGAEVTRRLDGYAARVAQHELDHLIGVEFLMRMSSLDSLTTVTNYLAHHRETNLVH